MPSAIVQKEMRARFSPIVRPVIFGNQKWSAAKPPKTAPPTSAKWVAAVESVVFFSSQAAATIEWSISAARPIEIEEMAPSANSSGARIRSAPRPCVAIRLKTIRPKGTISASDISIAKYIQPIPIGAVSMFCIQARVPSTAIATSDPMTTPRLTSGRPEKAATISAIAPKAKIRISM